MLDLNHILLFIAWASPAILLIRSWRGDVAPGWRRSAMTVLLVTALANVFARPLAGFIGAGAWLGLLVLPAIAIRKAIESAERGDFKRARGLLRAVRVLHSKRSLLEQERVVSAIEIAHAQGRRFSRAHAPPKLFGQARVRMTAAVATMIGLNVAMFAAEIAFGGSTSFVALHRLGALEPRAVLVANEYWRLLTATFLHYGTLHLGVNLLALWFFGPTLEKLIGSARFTISYLFCGIAACAQVALMWRLRWFDADQLVGASGAVMGIVGTWAGVLLRERHLARNRIALRSILLILVIQSSFDLLTPQVSMAAHLGGFAAGLIAGWLIGGERARTTAADRYAFREAQL